MSPFRSFLFHSLDLSTPSRFAVRRKSAWSMTYVTLLRLARDGKGLLLSTNREPKIIDWQECKNLLRGYYGLIVLVNRKCKHGLRRLDSAPPLLWWETGDYVSTDQIARRHRVLCQVNHFISIILSVSPAEDTCAHSPVTISNVNLDSPQIPQEQE